MALPVLLGLLAPGANAESRLLAAQGAITPVEADAGRVVWSRFDPRSERFRLVEYRAGAVRALRGVRSRSVPFDVDIGTDSRGRSVATFSRCRREAYRDDHPRLFTPTWEYGEGCQLRLYDFRWRRERLLPVRGRPHRSRYLPTMWRGRLAFVEAGARHGVPPGIHIESTLVAERSDGRWRTVKGGLARQVNAGGPTRNARATAIDRRGSWLVFTWSAPRQHCTPEGTSADDLYGPVRSEVWLVSVETAERRHVDSACTPSHHGPEVLRDSSLGPTGAVTYYAGANILTTGIETPASFRLYEPLTGAITQQPAPLAIAMVALGNILYFVAQVSSENSAGNPVEIRSEPTSG